MTGNPDHDSPPELRIFICYRRKDSLPYAGRLYDSLVDRLDRVQVFMDIDTIRPGVDFTRALSAELARCDVVLAIIGRSWLIGTDEIGRRRLDDPHDFVRRELTAALSRRIVIIPLLVGGATMPDAHQLPDALAELATRQALELSDLRWRADVQKLTDELARLAREKADSRPRESGDQRGRPPALPEVARERPSMTDRLPITPSRPGGTSRSSAAPNEPVRLPYRSEAATRADTTGSALRSPKDRRHIKGQLGGVLLFACGIAVFGLLIWVAAAVRDTAFVTAIFTHPGRGSPNWVGRLFWIGIPFAAAGFVPGFLCVSGAENIVDSPRWDANSWVGGTLGCIWLVVVFSVLGP